MIGTKQIWQSRTVIAAFVGFFAVGIDLLFGRQIEDEGAVVDAILQVIQGLAFLGALWGRLMARKRLA